MDSFINFALSDKSILNLKISDNVFVPTATTNFLIDAVKNNENNKKKILDLGCGTGIVGIALSSLNLGDKKVLIQNHNFVPNGVYPDYIIKLYSLFFV